MVCNRCISILQTVLEKQDLVVNEITLGKVGISYKPETFNENVFSNLIMSLGFSLAVNRNSKVVETVKSVIKEHFENIDPLEERKRFSELISDTLNMSYDNISAIFTAHERVTIENYIIVYRIGLVKNMLIETELTLTEMAYRIGFSNIHHLSKQFKEVIGISPSEFRALRFSENKNIVNQSGNIIQEWTA